MPGQDARIASSVRATSLGARLSRSAASRTWTWMAPAPAATAALASRACCSAVTGMAGCSARVR